MSDRDFLRQVILCFRLEINHIERAWKGVEMPLIPAKRIEICREVVQKAQDEIRKLNEASYDQC